MGDMAVEDQMKDTIQRVSERAEIPVSAVHVRYGADVGGGLETPCWKVNCAIKWRPKGKREDQTTNLLGCGSTLEEAEEDVFQSIEGFAAIRGHLE